MSSVVSTDVVIVGAGPAGLTAATKLSEKSSARVLVVERESEAGGIPRHSDHLGYGIRDKRRFLTGPNYARRLVDEATDAGATILTRTMVTSWGENGELNVTGPHGRDTIQARHIILATGARERPRPARMIPGGRPAGVLTTGELQNKVHLSHQQIGDRAVVVGGELVSWSAVMTLREAGCRAMALVTKYPTPESYGLFNLGGRLLFGTRVVPRHRVTQVLGRHRVTGVEVEETSTGRREVIDCDTVVFTGDWIPDHELARSAGITMDHAMKGPVVDSIGRTDRPGVFAAGNLVHPVDTADVAALGGAHVARAVRHCLGGAEFPVGPAVPIVGDAPFTWVSPGLCQPGLPAPARGRIETWVDDLVRIPQVTVRQEGRVIERRTLPWPASPGRVFRVPWDLLRNVNPDRGAVHLSL